MQISFLIFRIKIPQHIDIGDENTKMMEDGGSSNPLVYQDVGQVLDSVHGGHVGHDLGVGGVLHGVQDTDITSVKCHQSNEAENYL